MKNKNIVFVIALIIVVVVAGIFWLGIRKISTIPDDSGQGQMSVNTENTQDSVSVIEKQPKTLDDLLAQAEEIQLPKVDTTGWQTYRDEKLGVEFMYPKGWKIKMYGEYSLCVSTIDGRYGKIPSSSAQVLQGDECIFSIFKAGINEQSVVSEILQYKHSATWDDGQLSKIAQSYFSTPILMTLSEDDAHFYIKNEFSIMNLRVWNMDRKFKGVDDVLYGIFQTLKPIQK